MSYHVISYSLAEQTANLADVFSTIKVLPIAKTAILMEARHERAEVDGFDVPTIASLVDGFILYRYAWWNSLDANTFKKAAHIAWRRRKLRLKMSDEAGRTISGKNSNSSAVAWTNGSLNQELAGYPVTVAFTLEPVFADGSIPDYITLEVGQDAAQNGVSFVTTFPLSPGPTFDVVLSVDHYEVGSWMLGGEENGVLNRTIVLKVDATGYSYFVDSGGNSLTELSVSTASLKQTILMDLGDFDDVTGPAPIVF